MQYSREGWPTTKSDEKKMAGFEKPILRQIFW